MIDEVVGLHDHLKIDGIYLFRRRRRHLIQDRALDWGTLILPIFIPT